MTPEDEEFNRIEMESRIKQNYVRDIKTPSREALLAEVTVLTEMVRVLSDKVNELESKQEQPYAHEAAMYSNDRMTVDPQTGYVSIGKQEQGEPVAWAHKKALESISDFDASIYANGGFDNAIPLYTTPQQRKPLTNEEIMAEHLETDVKTYRKFKEWQAAHGIKEKNT
jgi:hypothetical protein